MSASAADRPILEARDIRVVSGRARARRTPTTLRLAGGRVHVLLGPNGAGKSTLLRALNGLETAEGELRFDGRPVVSSADRLALRRHTAAVFQKAYLLDTTVQENVESGLRLRGVGGERPVAGLVMRSSCSVSPTARPAAGAPLGG